MRCCVLKQTTSAPVTRRKMECRSIKNYKNYTSNVIAFLAFFRFSSFGRSGFGFVGFFSFIHNHTKLQPHMDRPTSEEASTASGLARLTQKQVRLRVEVTALQQVLRQSADAQAQWQKDQLATARRDLELLEKAQSDLVQLIDLLQKEIRAQERSSPLSSLFESLHFFTEASADVSLGGGAVLHVGGWPSWRRRSSRPKTRLRRSRRSSKSCRRRRSSSRRPRASCRPRRRRPRHSIRRRVLPWPRHGASSRPRRSRSESWPRS
jgi:hypothetical protein